MKNLFGLFARVYDYFAGRRAMLYTGTLFVVLLSIVGFRTINMAENIAAMLPDDASSAAEDFRLLQQAPFARKIIVNLKAGPNTDSRTLIEVTDRLAGQMQPPLFNRAITGPTAADQTPLILWLLESLPNLATDRDIARIRAGLTPSAVSDKLEEGYNRLLTPEGWVIKTLLQKDPLDLHRLGFEKLRYVNMIPGMRLADNHFLSADGKNALIIADTPVTITDSAGGRQLLTQFAALVSENVPADIEATFISGHRYTLANAATIKSDVAVILAASALMILVIFLLYLRSWRALFVYLVPVAVLCVSAVGVSLFFDTVSAITFGFGSVLMGIAVDFALHVYFALRGRDNQAADRLARVARPVLFGGLTTLGAFGVLLSSNLPGQRQLAVFSMIGIATALLISLITLPHLIRGIRPAKRPAPEKSPVFTVGRDRLILGAWLMMTAVCIWLAPGIHFEGNLRSINLVPDDLKAAETQLKTTWGNFRGTAMVFAAGKDLQQALKNNEKLFTRFKREFAQEQIVSLAPILPSEETQTTNRHGWVKFWSPQTRELVRSLLDTEGRPFRFSESAFTPFFDYLDRQPAPVTTANLNSIGLADLVHALIIQSKENDGVKILTLVPDTAEVRAAFNNNEIGSNVRLVSQARFGDTVGRAIRVDFTGFILKAGLMVVVLLLILFRNLKHALIALLPVATGLAIMFGVMSGLGLSFNLFNIIAAILIIGLGVDYGIFMVVEYQQGHDHDTRRAVLVSGLTTLAGFGALVFARHPALNSIGITVLLGIGAAIPTALQVIPAVYRKWP